MTPNRKTGHCAIRVRLTQATTPARIVAIPMSVGGRGPRRMRSGLGVCGSAPTVGCISVGSAGGHTGLKSARNGLMRGHNRSGGKRRGSHVILLMSGGRVALSKNAERHL